MYAASEKQQRHKALKGLCHHMELQGLCHHMELQGLCYHMELKGLCHHMELKGLCPIVGLRPQTAVCLGYIIAIVNYVRELHFTTSVALVVTSVPEATAMHPKALVVHNFLTLCSEQ